MTRRAVLTVFAAVAMSTAAAGPVLAHPGHEHKILGTVTMAAPDHLMLTDRDGKDVTVHITRETRVLRDKKPMTVADIAAGMRVVVTAVTRTEKGQEKTTATVIELGPPAPAK